MYFCPHYFLRGNWEHPITELPAPREPMLDSCLSPGGQSPCAQDAAAGAQELDSAVTSFSCTGPFWDMAFKTNLSQAARMVLLFSN